MRKLPRQVDTAKRDWPARAKVPLLPAIVLALPGDVWPSENRKWKSLLASWRRPDDDGSSAPPRRLAVRAIVEVTRPIFCTSRCEGRYVLRLHAAYLLLSHLLSLTEWPSPHYTMLVN